MEPARLEAFTDGVVAIIITIMVLEIRVPRGTDLASLQADIPVLVAYVLSYVNVGIFWNNHHHMLHVTERVDGKVLWANLASSSGCRWYRSSSAGSTRPDSRLCPRPPTASFSRAPDSVTRSCSGRSSP
jgi:hypothetical protein